MSSTAKSMRIPAPEIDPDTNRHQALSGDTSRHHAEIARRAYQIHIERGCSHGHDLDDWLQAECELRREPIVNATADPPQS